MGNASEVVVDRAGNHVDSLYLGVAFLLSAFCFLLFFVALKKIVGECCLYGMGQVYGRWHWEVIAELAPGKRQRGGGGPCRQSCK